LLEVRTFDSGVSGKLEVGWEIEMVPFSGKLLEFIWDKKRFQRYDPAFISGLNRINTSTKNRSQKVSQEKQIWGECQVCIWSSGQTTPLHDLKLLKFYTITFH